MVTKKMGGLFFYKLMHQSETLKRLNRSVNAHVHCAHLRLVILKMFINVLEMCCANLYTELKKQS